MEKNKREERTIDTVKGRKIIQIICSILVAVAIWAYVDEEKTINVSMHVNDLPVEFSGEDTVLADKGLMLLSGFDTTVDLTLKGPRKVLWKLNKSEIRIVADTASVQDIGTQTLEYDVVFPDNVQRSQIEVAKASIYSVTVTVGELFTKKVPIQCEVTGQVAGGFVAEEMQLDPVELELRGQRDDLLNVSYAKIHVSIAGARETVLQAVEYQLYDDNNIPITNSNVRASTKLVQVTMPVKTVKEVPLRLNFVEAPGSTMAQVTYSLDHDSVRLKGDAAVLDDIDSIVLDTIYLQDLKEYQTLNYTISVPADTQIVDDFTAVTVTITVNGVSERRVTTSAFACTNVPEGHEAVVVTESLSVLLRGLTEELNALTGEHLQITADLSGITGSGSFTVPVSVRINGYSNVGVKGSYQVIVNVTQSQVAPEGRTVPEGTGDAAVQPASVIDVPDNSTDTQAHNA